MDGSDGPIPLALGGGFLVRSERIQEQLLEWLHKFKVKHVAKLVTDPLEGCIRLADPQFAGTLVTGTTRKRVSPKLASASWRNSPLLARDRAAADGAAAAGCFGDC